MFLIFSCYWKNWKIASEKFVGSPWIAKPCYTSTPCRKKVTATVDYQAGARGSVRNVCDRDLQPWHWRLSAFGSRYIYIYYIIIYVSANPAFRFAKLWKSVEQLQHFDSKAYCFVMCGLGFPMIWLTIGRLLEITADTWKTTWTRMSWVLHGRLVHTRTGSHDTWHRNWCSTTIVM